MCVSAPGWWALPCLTSGSEVGRGSLVGPWAPASCRPSGPWAVGLELPQVAGWGGGGTGGPTGGFLPTVLACFLDPIQSRPLCVLDAEPVSGPPAGAA